MQAPSSDQCLSLSLPLSLLYSALYHTHTPTLVGHTHIEFAPTRQNTQDVFAVNMFGILHETFLPCLILYLGDEATTNGVVCLLSLPK